MWILLVNSARSFLHEIDVMSMPLKSLNVAAFGVAKTLRSTKGYGLGLLSG
jgi:hypothetical protein